MPKNNAPDVVAEESFRSRTETVSDPFATDFFAQSESFAQDVDEAIQSFVEIDLNGAADASSEAVWHDNLPQISLAEAKSLNLLSKIPAHFAPKILLAVEQNLSECITSKADAASCQVILTEEVNLEDEAKTLSDEQTVFLNFSVEPNKRIGTLALPSSLAIEMIKKGFGDDSNAKENRELTKNELAVLEFFALCCLNEINQFAAQPLFRLRTIEQHAVSWLQQEQTDLGATRGLHCKIKIELGEMRGIASLLLPFEILNALNELNNPLLAASSRGKKVARFSKFASGVQMKIACGETELSSSDLAVLEAGDIVLIEHASVELSDKGVSGNVVVKVGAETIGNLHGDLITNGNLHLHIRETSENTQTDHFSRFKMQENQLNEQNEYESTEENETGPLALEKILVKLTVEIASRRISLDELASLRIGQIIELGARPTDPVELVVDDKTVAIGELIKIEDNLGVRLTRVLL